MNNLLKQTIPFSIATRTIIALNVAVIAFHITVLLQVIPFNIVWAGRLESESEMYVFESLSILINLALVAVVFLKTKNTITDGTVKILNLTLWIFVIVFVLNTLGNLTAKASIETYVATPLTFVLAILCWRAAIERKPNAQQTDLRHAG